MLNSPVAFEILSYLKDRPHGQDKKERIVNVMLTAPTAEQVASALAELVERCLLEELSGPDGRVHYRLADSARQGFSHFVKLERGTEGPDSRRPNHS